MTGTSVGTHTFQLFSPPSFIEGIGFLADITGSLNRYAESDSDTEADINALQSDWQAVGDDIRAAIKVYEQTQGGENK